MHKGLVDWTGSGAVRPYTITDSEDGQPQVLVVNDNQLIADANLTKGISTMEKLKKTHSVGKRGSGFVVETRKSKTFILHGELAHKPSPVKIVAEKKNKVIV
jgi:hypothetical protein